MASIVLDKHKEYCYFLLMFRIFFSLVLIFCCLLPVCGSSEELPPEKKAYFKQWLETHEGIAGWLNLNREQKLSFLGAYVNEYIPAVFDPANAASDEEKSLYSTTPEQLLLCIDHQLSLPIWNQHGSLLMMVLGVCEAELNPIIIKMHNDRLECVMKETGFSKEELTDLSRIMMNEVANGEARQDEKTHMTQFPNPKVQRMLNALAECDMARRR